MADENEQLSSSVQQSLEESNNVKLQLVGLTQVCVVYYYLFNIVVDMSIQYVNRRNCNYNKYWNNNKQSFSRCVCVSWIQYCTHNIFVYTVFLFSTILRGPVIKPLHGIFQNGEYREKGKGRESRVGILVLLLITSHYSKHCSLTSLPWGNSANSWTWQKTHTADKSLLLAHNLIKYFIMDHMILSYNIQPM